MRISPRLASFLIIGFLSAQALAADLTKIDRTIAKEPAYQTKTPKYCLLVFGAEAKTRVWLVLDGDVLYVDRNGNGDLSEAPKRCLLSSGKEPGGPGYPVWNAGDILESDGKTKHMGLRAWTLPPRGMGLSIRTAGGRAQHAWGDATSPLQFADRPQDAPIVHFDGPLRMALSRLPTLSPGSIVTLHPTYGTPGLGRGAFAESDLPARAKELKKKNVCPLAEIELAEKEGARPIKSLVKFEPDG